MAHKGKNYKLWFRRDASVYLNNYRQGFPEAFRVLTMGPQFSARYAVSLLPDVLAVNLNKTFTPVWTSEVVGGFFDNCFWRITLPVEPVFTQTFFKLEYIHTAIINTPLFSADFFTGLQNPVYGVVRRGIMKELHFLSPDITLDPDNFAFSCDAAPYHVYNP